MTYVAAAWWLPVPLAVLLSTAATIWLTGAFHEDGWADVCDGFGGGMTRADVLEIMKDSRLGTYGTIGLVMVLALKVGALIAISADGLVWAVLLAAHPLSRLAATTVIFSQRYVYADEESKAKPLATSISPVSLAVAFIFGGLPLLLIPFKLWWGTAAVVGITWWAARWFKRRIGGYTGDCLGAVQQLSETAFYLTAVGLLA